MSATHSPRTTRTRTHAGVSRDELPCSIPNGTAVFTCTYYKHSITSHFTRHCSTSATTVTEASDVGQCVRSTACLVNGEPLLCLKYSSGQELCPAADCDEPLHEQTWSFADTSPASSGHVQSAGRSLAAGRILISSPTDAAQAKALAQSMVQYVSDRNPTAGPRALLKPAATIPSAVLNTVGGGLAPVLNIASNVVGIVSGSSSMDIIQSSTNLGCMVAMAITGPGVPLGTLICSTVRPSASPWAP